MPTQPLTDLKGRIGAIMAEYIADQTECEECRDRTIVEIESAEIIRVIADTDLSATITAQFGTHCLATIVNEPEEGTIEFSEATVAKLAAFLEDLRKEQKLITLKDMFEQATGQTIADEDLPDSIKNLYILKA